jgi:hypothetical protein
MRPPAAIGSDIVVRKGVSRSTDAAGDGTRFAHNAVYHGGKFHTDDA